MVYALFVTLWRILQTTKLLAKVYRWSQSFVNCYGMHVMGVLGVSVHERPL